MPGTMIHILTAERILELLPKNTIKNESLFYIGAFAPDTIHSKKDYKREDKKIVI